MRGLVTLSDLPELGGSDPTPRTTITIGRLDDNLRDPRYGKFSIGQSDVDSWKRNLAGVLGGQVAIDFDHSSDRGKGTRAAAWITGIDQTGTASGSLITADVQFTRAGARAIRDGDYKYTSPTFVENYTDEHGVKHGKALIGAALTNRPVLRKGMPTLSLSRDEFDGVALATVSAKTRKKTATLKGKGKPEFPMPDKLHARLALQFVSRSLQKGNITPEDAAKIRKRANAILGKGKKDASATQAARDSRPQMDLKALAKQLGLPKDSDEAAILAKVSELKTLAEAAPAKKEDKPEPKADEGKQELARTNEDGTISLSADGYAELLTKANAGQAAATQLSELTFQTAWSKALSEGRAAPSQEESLKELYDLKPELAIKTLDSFVKVVPTKPTGSGEGAGLEAPDGMDPERYQLHSEAKALAAKKLEANTNLDPAEAYILATQEIEDRKFALEHPGI